MSGKWLVINISGSVTKTVFYVTLVHQPVFIALARVPYHPTGMDRMRRHGEMFLKLPHAQPKILLINVYLGPLEPLQTLPSTRNSTGWLSLWCFFVYV